MDAKAQFIRLLRQACLDTIAVLPERFPGETFYGFVLNPSDNCIDIAAALSTRAYIESHKAALPADHQLSPELLEALKAHPDLLAKAAGAPSRRQTADVDITEWKHLGAFPDTFRPMNDALERFHRANEFRDIGWAAVETMFEEVFVAVTAELKSRRRFRPARVRGRHVSGRSVHG